MREPWPITGSDSYANAVLEVLESGRLTVGENVGSFESRLADRLCIDPMRVVMVSSGTAALELAVRSLVNPGEVILHPAVGFMASALAIQAAKARVVFVDVDPMTGLIDPDKMFDALLREGWRAKGVMVVDLDGRSAPVEEVEMITGLPVIEDACAALGSSDCGRRGYASALSFNATKIVHTGGEGGAIVAQSIPMARWYRQARSFGETSYGTLRTSTHWGTNVKPTEIAAAIGLVELGRLDDRIERAKTVEAAIEAAALECSLTHLKFHTTDRPHKIRARIPEGATWTRDMTESILNALGVPTMGPDVAPLHRHPAFGGSGNEFPGADEFIERTIIYGRRDYPPWHVPTSMLEDWTDGIASFREEI